MEMHQIRYFLAVARTLNFTRAAEECRVSQPALSQAIGKLEDELGGPLFRRERALTHLTDLGRVLAPLLARCHESALAARDLAISIGRGEAAPLRLGLSQGVGLGPLVPALSELARHFPGLELVFLRAGGADVLRRLKAGDCELAVAVRMSDPWDRLEVHPLFAEGYRLAVAPAHRFAPRNAVELGDLAGERLLARRYCEHWDELAPLLARHGARPSGGGEAGSDADLAALVAAGLGVALLPESVLPAGALRGLAVIGLDLRREVCLYGVAGRRRGAPASALARLLRAADWSERQGLEEPAPMASG